MNGIRRTAVWLPIVTLALAFILALALLVWPLAGTSQVLAATGDVELGASADNRPGNGLGRGKGKNNPKKTTTTVETTTSVPTSEPPGTTTSTVETTTSIVDTTTTIATTTTTKPTATTLATTTSTSSSTTAPPTTTPGTEASCPDGLVSTIPINGERFSKYRNTNFANRTYFDATSAVWNGNDSSGAPIPWVVTLRSDGGQGNGSCWDGGIIRGSWDENDPDISWEEPYHHSGGLTIDVPGLTVVNLFIDNQGDGIRTEEAGSDTMIRRAHLTDIHDDCVENDYVHNITVSDSLFDGCYVGFSARPFNDAVGDSSNNTWTIRDSLMRLEPQPTVYRGPAPGHGGFFKWDERAPRVSLHNTIFRVDQMPNHGTIGIPSELEFESCSNNTMVWLGGGSFPEQLPDCFTITSDRSVWDNAVAAWKNN